MSMTEAERAATVTPMSVAVSDEVRVLLARRRLREAALGAVLGVSPQAVSTRMRGVKPWSLADLDALAAYFGVDANALLPGLGVAASATDGADGRRDVVTLRAGGHPDTKEASVTGS